MRRTIISCEEFPTSSQDAEMKQCISHMYKFALTKKRNMPKVEKAKICKTDSKRNGSRQWAHCL